MQVNTGDTGWILVASALVMFMTPGLALFYGGMVRSKNVMATIMQSFFMVGVVSVLWALIGYTLAFGPDKWHLIGGLDWIGLRGVGQEPFKGYGDTIPHLAFMVFQCMFAVITPALITGAFAERMKFKGFLAFTVLWLLLVYCPVAHWVWGIGGWIRNLGALDFAGGTVVHINSAMAALVAAILLGHRKGYRKEAFVPHNLTLTLLGAGILWFGWFGFNAGSALAANGLAANAFVVTNLGAAAAMISWVFAEWLHRGTPTTLGAASGAVAGLVAITPASGFVGPMAAIIIGLIAGAVCYGGVLLKSRLGYDDALDVVGVHGVGGTTGALLTGVFASVGATGLLLGNAHQLLVQLIAVAVTIGYSLVVSFLILKVVDAVIGLRVTEEGESTGLDLTEHAETGYAM